MTEKPKETGEKVIEEKPAPPVPEISAESETPSSEQFGTELAEIRGQLSDLQEQLSGDDFKGLISRGIKSYGDSRLAKVDEIYEWAKRAGGDPDKIRGELELSELRSELAELKGDIPVSEVRGGTPGAGGVADAMEAISKEILSGADIAFDDPQYVALVGEYGNRVRNPEHWRSVLESHVDRRTTKTSKQAGVTPATAVSAPGGAAAPEGAEQEALLAELNELYAGQHGSLATEANRKRMKEISGKLDEMSPPEVARLA